MTTPFGIHCTRKSGLSQLEMLVGLAVAFGVLLFFMGFVTLDDFGTESGRGILLKTRLLYAAQRVRDMRTDIRMYMDFTGRLPGDDPAGSKHAPGGNGNGRIEVANGERDRAMIHMRDAGIIPHVPPMLLGFEVQYFWIDGPFLGHARGGHYFKVVDCPVWLAKYLDQKIDDGRAEEGDCGWTRRRGAKTDLYIRFDP